MNLFIDGDESLRAARFLAEYRRRGFDPDEAKARYRKRYDEEFPSVEAQRCRADNVLSLPADVMPERIAS
jgi:hypothetical protein